jgi:hypothetical protein
MERIGQDVRRELSRFGPAAQLGELVTRWPAAVGDSIARNAWPARIQRDGTLIVHASSSAWAFELTQLESQVRESLGRLAPRRIRFMPGPLPSEAESSPEEATPERAPPSAEALATAADIASSIDDERLRKLVARAAAASMSEARSARSF